MAPPFAFHKGLVGAPAGVQMATPLRVASAGCTEASQVQTRWTQGDSGLGQGLNVGVRGPRGWSLVKPRLPPWQKEAGQESIALHLPSF